MPKEEELLGVLRFDFDAPAPLSDLKVLLSDLELAYSSVYAFELYVQDIQEIADRYGRPYPLFPYDLYPPRSVLLGERISEEAVYLVPPEHRLQLHGAEFHSPGWWEFLGKLNILEVLRQWAQDRHERRRDKEIREPAEREKLFLENQLLKNKVVEERIAILKAIGLPRAEIRRIVGLSLIRPLNGLSKHINDGQLRNPRLENKTEKKPPGRKPGDARTVE